MATLSDRTEATWQLPAEGITVRTDGGARLPAGLVIGADGRGSGLRKLAGIGLQRWSYGHAALGFIVRHPVDNGGAVLERMRKGGPLATLPLRADRTGITWVETPERAKALAEGERTQLLAELDEALGHALGEPENARDPSEVDALVLAHALDLAQRRDIPQRVPTATARPTLRNHESEAVVLSKRLSVHAREFRRGGDQEDGLVDVGLLHDAPTSPRPASGSRAGCPSAAPRAPRPPAWRGARACVERRPG